MDSALRELYQDMILDHSRHPRNFGKCKEQTHHGEGYNPLCGDRVAIGICLFDDRIKHIAFEGEGCAICMASSSLMTERVLGLAWDEVTKIGNDFRRLLTDSDLTDEDRADYEARLGKVAILGGVRAFPMRIKCATLPFHTLAGVCQTQNKDKR